MAASSHRPGAASPERGPPPPGKYVNLPDDRFAFAPCPPAGRFGVSLWDGSAAPPARLPGRGRSGVAARSVATYRVAPVATTIGGSSNDAFSQFGSIRHMIGQWTLPATPARHDGAAFSPMGEPRQPKRSR